MLLIGRLYELGLVIAGVLTFIVASPPISGIAAGGCAGLALLLELFLWIRGATRFASRARLADSLTKESDLFERRRRDYAAVGDPDALFADRIDALLEEAEGQWRQRPMSQLARRWLNPRSTDGTAARGRSHAPSLEGRDDGGRRVKRSWLPDAGVRLQASGSGRRPRRGSHWPPCSGSPPSRSTRRSATTSRR